MSQQVSRKGNEVPRQAAATERSDRGGSAARRGPHPADETALRRLRSIEGQIAGIRRMVAEERYCIDVLTQVSAVRAALNALGLHVLKRHLDHCVADAVREDGDDLPHLVDELMAVLARTSI